MPCRHKSYSNASSKTCSEPIPKPIFMRRKQMLSGNATWLDVELSLHHDLTSVEADWRAFEANADCTVFQTFDWLSTWFRNIGVHEAGKPVILIGRHEGTILSLMPFALNAVPASARSSGSLVSVQLQWAGAGARVFAARRPATVHPALAGYPIAAAAADGP